MRLAYAPVAPRALWVSREMVSIRSWRSAFALLYQIENQLWNELIELSRINQLPFASVSHLSHASKISSDGAIREADLCNKSVDCSHFSQVRGSDYEGRNVSESCRDCLAGLPKSHFSWAIVRSTNWLFWCVQLWTLQEHNMVCKKCICQCKCQRESTKANG